MDFSWFIASRGESWFIEKKKSVARYAGGAVVWSWRPLVGRVAMDLCDGKRRKSSCATTNFQVGKKFT